MKAAQTPLAELLRDIPITERIILDDGNYTTHHIPVGRHCHDAADLIEAQAREIGALKSLISDGEKPFCAGTDCKATRENIVHSRECLFEHFMSYTGYGLKVSDSVKRKLKRAYFDGSESLANAPVAKCNHIWTIKYELDGDINSPCYAVCTFCGVQPDCKAPEETKVEKELISDGWIEASTVKNITLNPYDKIDIKTECGKTIEFSTGEMKVNLSGLNIPYNVVAYRIISELEEKKPSCVTISAADMPCNNKECSCTVKSGCLLKKEPKKQTLIEFMDSKTGYTGELLPKDAFERRQVYVNMSEYLESI